MFTGIVSGVGTLLEREAVARFLIACPYKRRSLEEGASIACDGCCLTIVEIGKAKGKGARLRRRGLQRDAGAHHARHAGRRDAASISNGRSRFGDELGGHLVTGHVDGRAKILARERRRRQRPGSCSKARASSPPSSPPKGSVALDGVSLTVNDVDGDALRREHHSLHSCAYDMGRPQPRRSGKP